MEEVILAILGVKEVIPASWVPGEPLGLVYSRFLVWRKDDEREWVSRWQEGDIREEEGREERMVNGVM